jgi:poly(A) polymerase
MKGAQSPSQPDAEPHDGPTPRELSQLVDQALLSPEPDVELERLVRTGLMKEVFPEVHAMVGFGGVGQGHKDLWDHTKQVVAQTVPRREVRWAALFHDVGKVHTFSREGGKVSFHSHELVSARSFDRAARRAGHDSDFRKHVRFLVRHLGYVESYASEWTDSAVRRVHRETGAYFDDLVALARADITTRHTHKRRQHQTRMDELELRAQSIARRDAVPPALPKGLGTALIETFGIPPGPRVGQLIAGLKRAVETGELPAGAEPEVYLEYLRARGANESS